MYNCEEGKSEPVGGAARFKTAIDKYKHLNPLVVFAGDAFFPSMMSTILKGAETGETHEPRCFPHERCCRAESTLWAYAGKQMVPIMNAMGIHVACVGNHEFDMGVDHLKSLLSETNFPWLM